MVAKAPDETRAKILQAAFEEIHLHGFQGASISQICAKAGTTKGGLFHHFPTKQDLGFAVIDECCSQIILTTWVDPLKDSQDPVSDLLSILSCCAQKMEQCSCDVKNGCPLNNLAQEMSPLDERFRERIEKIYSQWRKAIEVSFKNGLKNRTVRADVDPKSEAAYIVATLVGAICGMKNSQDVGLLKLVGAALMRHLEGLRA